MWGWGRVSIRGSLMDSRFGEGLSDVGEDGPRTSMKASFFQKVGKVWVSYDKTWLAGTNGVDVEWWGWGHYCSISPN